MMISIIVVTYNRKNLLRQCLQSLLNQNYHKKYEIIVIDNASSDATAGLIKNEYPKKVKFLRRNARSPLSVCKNEGIKIALGDIIAFIDDDCWAKDNWLRVIEDSLINHDLLGGAVLPAPRTIFPWWWRNSLNWLIGINPVPAYTFLPLGSNIAFKKYVLEKIRQHVKSSANNFHQHLPYAQDNYRVRQALSLGFSLLVKTELIVYHHLPKERLKFFSLTRRSYQEGVAWVCLEKNRKTFIVSFVAFLLAPLRLIFSWDINRFFRMVVRLSYIANYFRKRQAQRIQDRREW